jgi:hypothetical protein
MTPENLNKETNRTIERKLVLRCFARLLTVTAGVLLLFSAAGPVAIAQDASTLVVLRPVTAKLKKGEKSHAVVTTPLLQTDVAEIRIGGKPATITAWTPLLKGTYGLQIMILLDSMEQIGVNEEFDDIKKFIGGLPPNVEIGVGYLLQGKAKITQTFTTDRKLAGDALKEPQETTLPKNDNGNPFACLRDLAAHWPSPDQKKLRAVLMISDGIIRSNATPQGSDALNPDVDSANQSLTRAGIMPFPFYYLDPVPLDPNRGEGGQLEGQQNMDQLATGAQGQALYDGQFAPGTFAPLLDRFFSILNSMAVATIDVKGSGFKTVDVKSSRDDIGVQAPDSVTLGNVLKTK